MIATIFLGALLQAAPLRPEVWKERNHPDMPTLPSCELGDGAVMADALDKLPADVAAALSRLSSPPMSDAGGPFNSTDFTDEVVPTTRFLRAYQAGVYWVVWYELGGRFRGEKTIAFRLDHGARNLKPTFRVEQGSGLTGNLCVATKAILSGVRSTN